jgi:hypothetical protein
VKPGLFTTIIRLARNAPEETGVPYAFAKRVMAHLSLMPQDIWAVWLPTMKNAALGGLAVLALTSIFVGYVHERPADLLAGDLERTVLASVNLDETW